MDTESRSLADDLSASFLSELRDFAQALLPRAGDVALRHFRAVLQVDDKGGRRFDPVTAADREVEALLRAALLERYPQHGVLGEENGAYPAQGDMQWIVDPIDGTRAFITGMPSWGILLGLLHRGRPRLGFMHQPFTGELFFGDGREASLRHGGRDLRLRTSAVAALRDASLYTTHPEFFATPADTDAFHALAKHCRLSLYGGDCYNYCMLAAGHVDLVVESGLAAYDILPLVPILEGAGGVVSDWHGQPLRGGGQVLAAATPALHRAALEVLTGAR